MIDDPITLLERELLDAARRRAEAPASGARGAGTLIALAASLLVTLAVAGAILATHDASPGHRAAEQPALNPTDQRLVAILGVLRRPQTAQDRRMLRQSRVLDSPSGGPVIAATARLATITPWGSRVLLVLRAAAPRGSGFGPMTAGLDFEADHGGGCCATRAVLVRHGMVSLKGAGHAYAGGATAQRVYVVVPDGVARVTFISPARRGRLHGVAYPRPLRETVAVHGNVAAVQWQRPCCDTPAMIWTAADGHVIRRLPYGGVTGPPHAARAPAPAPETPLSRRAERDPDTPNPVTVTPRAPQLAPGQIRLPMAASFTILVRGQGYRVVMQSPAGCRSVTQTWSAEPIFDLRGQRFAVPLTPPGRWHWCVGRYTVTVAVSRRGHRRISALPFGTASFTIRR